MACAESHVLMRGRPKLTMTDRRRQVLELLREFAINEESMTFGQLARRAKLHDASSASRIVRDLKKMGHVE